MKAGSSFALTNLTDLRNNVIYNWANNSIYGEEAMNVNLVNNYFKLGPATANSKRERIVSIDKNKNSGTAVYDIWGKFFISGNYIFGSERATTDNWSFGVYNQFHNSYGTVSEEDKKKMRIESPYHTGDENNFVNTHTAEKAYALVLNLSGASLERDAVDARIIDEVSTGTAKFSGSRGSINGMIDSQSDVGGWPVLISAEHPSNKADDGITDEWKLAKKLDIEKFEANGRDLSTAYDNLEVYVNSLVQSIIEKQR